MNPVTKQRHMTLGLSNKFYSKLFCNGMNRRGFTLVEIVITIVVVGVLMMLSVVSLNSSLISSRDEERKTDINTLASYLENFYSNGSQYDSTIGQYPSIDLTNPLTDNDLTTNTNELNLLRDVEPATLVAPGSAATTVSSIISATSDTQTTAGILPQPTISQYVYQPISSVQYNGSYLCANLATQTCRKFNLYYRTEADNTVKMVTSRHQ